MPTDTAAGLLDLLKTIMVQAPVIAVLAYMYQQQRKDVLDLQQRYDDLQRRYRRDLRSWAKLPVDDPEDIKAA